jgi:thiol-disulfide isomerase/thioredoxin
MKFILASSMAAMALAGTGTSLDISNFKTEVTDSNNVWVVEFGSTMCGTCKEFMPTWESVVEATKNVKHGQVMIDGKEGMDLAMELGVMDQGIPNVQVCATDGCKSVMGGDALSAGVLKGKISQLTEGLVADADGVLQKAGAGGASETAGSGSSDAAEAPKKAVKKGKANKYKKPGKKWKGPPSLNPDNPDNAIDWEDPTLNFMELGMKFDGEKKHNLVVKAFAASAKHNPNPGSFMNLGVAYMRDASFGSRNMENYVKAQESFAKAKEMSGGELTDEMKGNFDALENSMKNDPLMAKKQERDAKAGAGKRKKKYQ